MPSGNQILKLGCWQQIINEKETAPLALTRAFTSLAKQGKESKCINLNNAQTANETASPSCPFQSIARMKSERVEGEQLQKITCSLTLACPLELLAGPQSQSLTVLFQKNGALQVKINVTTYVSNETFRSTLMFTSVSMQINFQLNCKTRTVWLTLIEQRTSQRNISQCSRHEFC